MLYWVRGQIVFRAAGGGIELGPADNMVLLPFTAPGRFLPIWTAGDQGVMTIRPAARCWPVGNEDGESAGLLASR